VFEIKTCSQKYLHGFEVESVQWKLANKFIERSLVQVVWYS